MKSQEAIRVFIIEDHEIVRSMLRKLIEQTTGLVVCGQAASAEEALPQFSAVRPEIVLVDLSLPGMDGLDFIKTLTATDPGIMTVAVSGHLESIYAQRALEAGARGYIPKENLVEAGPAIRHVYGGGLYLSNKI